MRLKTLFIASVALILIAAAPDRAEAKGIVLWGSGEHITELSSIPDDEAKLGYMYSYFSLFFLDVWSWNGQFVSYQGDTYSELPSQDPEAIALLLGVEAAAVSKPFSYRVPPFLYLLIAGIGCLIIKSRASGGRDDSEAEEGSTEDKAAA